MCVPLQTNGVFRLVSSRLVLRCGVHYPLGHLARSYCQRVDLPVVVMVFVIIVVMIALAFIGTTVKTTASFHSRCHGPCQRNGTSVRVHDAT